MTVTRRQFLKFAGSATLLASMRGGQVMAQSGGSPVFWVQLFATGGWDQMLFCDPKWGIRSSMNGAYHSAGQLKTVSGIQYVDAYDPLHMSIRPVDPFFQEFGSRLLVINGVDTSTNNHDVGIRYWMSGSLLEGFPIFAAQVAGALGANNVMPLVDISGYDDGGGLVVPVRLDYTALPTIGRLRNPNSASGGEFSDKYQEASVQTTELLAEKARASVKAAQSARLLRLRERMKLPQHVRAMSALQLARKAVPGLANLDVPDIGSGSVQNLVLMGINAFKAGLATSMTLSAGDARLDAHGVADYDTLEALGDVFETAKFIANSADTAGVPTVIVMSSDFGRTPVRETSGSGHWPISSMMVLQNTAAKNLNIIPSGKVIGTTTGSADTANDVQTVLRAQKINPKTHVVDAGGVVLSPAHVFRALRRAAGIADHAALRGYPIAIEGNDLEL